MSEIIVGIDLGTTNSAVAVVQDGQPRILAKGEQKIIPSVVGYSQQSGWLVGQPALNQYALNPTNTVRSIKRKMGSDERVSLGGREFTPQEISAFILRELKAIAEKNLGQPVTKAVITVPAYFTNAQRQATQEAGQIAGLEVVRIINEPTAAALAYGLNQEDDQLALVYDLGGGTFDVSLVEMTGGVVEVRASHGDTHLGGDDFDHILAEHGSKLFYKKHQLSLKENRVALARLDRAAEAAKVHLSNYSEALLREEYLLEQNNVPYHLEATVERSEFEEMTEALLARTIESLEKVFTDAELSPDEVDRVLLVGGATRMPAVWTLVANYTGLEPDAEINPDEVVALGAAVQAAIIAGQPVDSILVDVTPYSLGIEAATRIGNQLIPDIYSVLIQRNTTIPVTKEQIFQTVHPNQKAVHVKVYQGEAPIASANTLLGDFLIEGLEPDSPGENPTVNVRFDFDVNGMLRVSATDRKSGRQKSVSVEASQARLTPHEIAEARERLSDLDILEAPFEAEEADAPMMDEETQALLNRAQQLLESDTLTEPQKTLLLELLDDIDEAETQDELDDLSAALLDALFDLE
ncbi:MAG: Hsp70 family protein [Anaerolineae bacterium]|nr:Hsp70 family protein [Anaerolineae bacterium]